MLTDLAVRAAKPKAKPYKLGDGCGLYLYVSLKGAKSWRYNYAIGGRQKTLTLGLYDDVTLLQARERLQEARRLVAAGEDPAERRRHAKGRHNADTTFAAVGRTWLTGRARSLAPRTETRSRWLLERVLIPSLGHRPVGSLTPADVLAALATASETPVTARRAKSVCSQVLRYAVAHGWAARDVTADLKGALATAPAVRHHAAVTDPREVGALLRAIDSLEGTPLVRAALQFAALVFVRPGELRLAEWKDVDTAGKLWRIPAARMKQKAAHLVPLSSQAIAVLETAAALTGKGRYIFPAVRTSARPMSNNTLNAALRRLGYDKHAMTAHGFRATARTLLAEQLHADPFVIEVQLAHAAPGPLGAAYNRARYLPQRTVLMQTWADYLDTLRETP